MDQVNNLVELGLTLNEARIYYALLKIKRGSIDEISKSADIHRRNVYDTLERLQQKGLITQVVSSKTLLFSPVSPEKLSEFVEERQNALKNTLPHLNVLYNKKMLLESAMIYKGAGGLKSYINLILKVKKDIYGIGSKGTWFDPRITKLAQKYKDEYDKIGIKSTLIYDFEMKKHPEVMKEIGKPYKFLPKNFSTSSSIDIFGEYVAIYSGVNVKELGEEISIFIIRNRTLAKDYKKWFDLLWHLLPE